VMATWKGGHLMKWSRVNGLCKSLSFIEQQNLKEDFQYRNEFSIGWR
jgi:hypothetical protein